MFRCTCSYQISGGGGGGGGIFRGDIPGFPLCTGVPPLYKTLHIVLQCMCASYKSVEAIDGIYWIV